MRVEQRHDGLILLHQKPTDRLSTDPSDRSVFHDGHATALEVESLGVPVSHSREADRFRAIEELKHILDQIDSHSTHVSSPGPVRTGSASSVEGLSIGFSHLFNNSASSADNSLSPGQRPRNVLRETFVLLLLVIKPRSSSTSSMQLIQQSIRIYLRSYRQLYDKLKACEQDTVDLIEGEFPGQLGCRGNDQQPFVRTLWLSHRTRMYSSWIHRADKFLKDLVDLHESFRKVSVSPSGSPDTAVASRIVC